MSPKRTVFLASIGAGFEYYDFIIYGLLATYISKSFFPSSDGIIALIQTFSIFALGYLVRPIGGFIFGHLGDRYSRKNIFLISLVIMALATTSIGMIPSYKEWGVLATISLILLRILQGLAFGIELPGTMTFVAEHANKSARGIYCSFVLSSVSIGATLGAMIIFVLIKTLSTEQLVSWGWRIPFWLGGVLAIFSYFIRKKLQETPLFIKSQPHAFPFYKLVRDHYKQLLLGVGISLFTACFIIFGVSLPSYLQRFHNYPSDYVYFMISVGLVWAALVLPIFGWLSDRIGRTQLLKYASISMIIGGLFLFALLNTNSLVGLGVFIIIYETIVAALASCYLPILAELFPTSVRISGVAFCYNIVYAIAGFTPALLSKWVSANSHTFSTALFFMALACSTFVFAFFVNDQTQQELT